MAMNSDWIKTATYKNNPLEERGWNEDFFHDQDSKYSILKTTRGVLFDLKRRFSDFEIFFPSPLTNFISERGANLTGLVQRIGSQHGLDVTEALNYLVQAFEDLFSSDRRERSVFQMDAFLEDPEDLIEVIERAIQIQEEDKEECWT